MFGGRGWHFVTTRARPANYSEGEERVGTKGVPVAPAIYRGESAGVEEYGARCLNGSVEEALKKSELRLGREFSTTEM